MRVGNQPELLGLPSQRSGERGFGTPAACMKCRRLLRPAVLGPLYDDAPAAVSELGSS